MIHYSFVQFITVDGYYDYNVCTVTYGIFCDDIPEFDGNVITHYNQALIVEMIHVIQSNRLKRSQKDLL